MGWAAYIKFEMRQGEIKRARAIYERYIALLPTCRSYLKYARWEEHQGSREKAREVYERALGGELPPEEQKKQLLVSFARFEERCKEYERARVIFQYAIEQAGDSPEAEDLKTEFTAFEKRHGDREGIEDVIINNRRDEYEKKLEEEPYNYDTWFDLIRLEEAEVEGSAPGSEVRSRAVSRAREAYERAVGKLPPLLEKRYWRRYIYLWIGYAVFEELLAGGRMEEDGKELSGIDCARAVYKECLRVIPHKKFTFGKIWLNAAHLEVRARDLSAARRLLGQAIGMCGKENIFKGYIELELQLGEVERCRVIYGKYLEFMPHNCTAWMAFAQLEVNVGETTRARAIYELAISQPELDMPEMLWKAYIDFEISEREADKVRDLYARLLDRTNHVKVWISSAQFEASELGGGLEASRRVFNDGYAALKADGLKEERVLLLEAWKTVESEQVDSGGDPQSIEQKMPRKIKMRRMSTAEGAEGEWEEYYDYHFPDDEKNIAGIKILENAMKWKKMQEAAATSSTDDSSSMLRKRKAESEGETDET